MAVTIEMVLEAAAEFAGLATTSESGALVSTEITRAIADADAQVSLTAWGTLRDRAVVLLAAHGLSKNHPGARPGDNDTKRYVEEFERIRGTLGLTMTVL